MASKTTKLNIIGFKELRENAENYIRRVEKGESFTVMRRSQPIFRITPVDADESIWETIADFTEIDSRGIKAKDLISAINKKLHGQR